MIVLLIFQIRCTTTKLWPDRCSSARCWYPEILCSRNLKFQCNKQVSWHQTAPFQIHRIGRYYTVEIGTWLLTYNVQQYIYNYNIISCTRQYNTIQDKDILYCSPYYAVGNNFIWKHPVRPSSVPASLTETRTFDTHAWQGPRVFLLFVAWHWSINRR